jgi:hypothetical protein
MIKKEALNKILEDIMFIVNAIKKFNGISTIIILNVAIIISILLQNLSIILLPNCPRYQNAYHQ